MHLNCTLWSFNIAIKIGPFITLHWWCSIALLNYPRVHVNGFFLSRNGNTWPKGAQFNGARRKPRQLSGCSSHLAIKRIFGIPPTSPNMLPNMRYWNHVWCHVGDIVLTWSSTCSYHKNDTKKWPGLLGSEMLTLLAVANSICRPWAAPHRAQWSKSPAEIPVTAGALPHFGVCIWVMSGNSMHDLQDLHDVYVCMLGLSRVAVKELDES